MPPIATRKTYLLHEATISLFDEAIAILESRHDDEAVHEARKACKRIRAALRLLRESVGSVVYRRENSMVRGAAKPLTSVRDAFILRKTLRKLPQTPEILRQGLDSEYREARLALGRSGAKAAVEQLATIRDRFKDHVRYEPEAVSAIAGVKRVYKVGRKAMKQARHRNDEALHEWRKQVKYLMNQFRVLNMVFCIRFKKMRRHADELTQALGDDHDLVVLINKLRAYHVQDPKLVKSIGKRRDGLQERAFCAGRKLYHRSAKDLAAVVAQRVLKTH
jgi:CHAD domain-containing protein